MKYLKEFKNTSNLNGCHECDLKLVSIRNIFLRGVKQNMQDARIKNTVFTPKIEKNQMGRFSKTQKTSKGI